MRNTIILALVMALAFVCYRLVQVENERYALMLGMCPGNIATVDPHCLSEVQTRTSWTWHLYYALVDR